MVKAKKDIRDVLGFNDTWFLIVGIPVVSFCIPLLFFNGTLNEGVLSYLPKWGVSLFYTIAYWFTTRAVIIRMRRRCPSYKDTRKRLIYSSIFILITYAIVNQLLDFVHDRYFLFAHDPKVDEFDYNVASLLVLSLCVLIYESVFLYDRLKQSILEKEQIKQDHIQSQLEGLKAQVNPHFLFNSLNTLTYIIPEAPEKAVTFVQKLSKVYRYILEIREKKLIPLSEELEFLKAYMFLLKERFGENLHFDIRVSPDDYQDQIVPLALQILFENAIKHNIISAQKPLTVEVFITDDEHLCVRNNLQKKKQTMNSTHLGLQNIKNRYAFFTDKAVIILQDEQYFKVCLPLIKVLAPMTKS